MGTIVSRKRKDGTTGYSAQILVKRKGQIVHRETQTFDRKQAAQAWLKKREAELATPGAIERVKAEDPTLREVIDRYLTEAKRALGRTKLQVLRTTKTHAIADMACSQITSADIVAFASELQCKPQTRANYLSHLSAIFAVARPAWGYPLDHQAVKDAIVVAKRLGVTGRSKERDRRPTLDELDKLMRHYADRQLRRPTMNPMTKLIAFAIFSTRRMEEITRIRWSDLQNGRVMVRDMKSPGEKVGNDVWVDLVPEAEAIIRSMPKAADEIFPYGCEAISASFTRACAFLGIEDLHFHDLRHDGVSRLFELGWNIPHVAAVSGHRSWSSLKRYTHIRQTGDKYQDWPWLAEVTKAGMEVRGNQLRGEAWYKTHGNIVNLDMPSRGRKPHRPLAKASGK